MRQIALTAAVVLTAAVLHAHDFWIEPSTFHPEPGSTVSVGLRVGQDFVGDAVPRVSTAIERFVVIQHGDEESIAGMEGTDPAGWFQADGRSTAVIAYRSRTSLVEMAPAKFEEYLRLQGLENVIKIRMKRGEHLKPSRELFSRCAKALLTGKQTSPTATQPLGLRYEIVPSHDPTVSTAPFVGRVLYEGRPLPGALVIAVWQSNPAVRMGARSGRDGAFSFAFPHAGVWLIKSVQMVDAPSGSGAEWESLWASLTFEAPGSAAMKHN
ncbi:MAG: hypothetical protein QOC81_4260 [Thermoanaerobaculia bacterium]|nr:hypothetical protein [Thermoanaerobaculia bacterium]